MIKKTTYPQSIGIRFTDEAQRDIARIIQATSRPGLEINRSQAVHMALAAFAATLPPLEGEKVKERELAG